MHQQSSLSHRSKMYKGAVQWFYPWFYLWREIKKLKMSSITLLRLERSELVLEYVDVSVQLSTLNKLPNHQRVLRIRDIVYLHGRKQWLDYYIEVLDERIKALQPNK